MYLAISDGRLYSIINDLILTHLVLSYNKITNVDVLSGLRNLKIIIL